MKKGLSDVDRRSKGLRESPLQANDRHLIRVHLARETDLQTTREVGRESERRRIEFCSLM